MGDAMNDPTRRLASLFSAGDSRRRDRAMAEMLRDLLADVITLCRRGVIWRRDTELEIQQYDHLCREALADSMETLSYGDYCRADSARRDMIRAAQAWARELSDRIASETGRVQFDRKHGNATEIRRLVLEIAERLR